MNQIGTMKKIFKTVLLATFGIGSVTVAMANVTSYNGDLMIGFTKGSGTDLVYDLGSVSSITNGQTWPLASVLTTAGLYTSLTTLDWGVVGSGTAINHNPNVWLTSPVDPGTINSGTFGLVRSAVTSLMSQGDFTAAGYGNYATPDYGLSYSWYSQAVQTIQSGASGTAFSQVENYYSYTNAPGSVPFYVQNSSTVTDQRLGTFTLSSTGVLTYNTLSVSVSTNAYLTSLVLNPVGLTSTFVSNTFSYLATNAYGTPTVTVVNADLTATNKLIYGGTTNLLTSGVASSGLALTLGVTNVVKVQVTAQDGVTVNTYQVNVIELPNLATAPKMTNSVNSGKLFLSWPADRLGFRLLVQTNNLAKGISSNTNDWATVPGSTATFTTNFPIVSTNNGFYRLVYP